MATDVNSKEMQEHYNTSGNDVMEQLVAAMMAMGHDPLAKKNATGADYTDTLHHDTYDFINPKQFDLKGRAVFITGASRGIGLATAVSYAKAGASYIGLGARSSLEKVEKEIQEAAKSVGKPAPKVLALKLDVTSKESVAEAAKETEKAFGRCDILVNNSGYLEASKPITDSDPDDWWQTFTVNILGPYLMCRAFIPLMLKQPDGLKTIASLSSIYGTTTMVGSSAYQMTKFATCRFSQLLNAEYGDQGLLSYSIHPGGIKTDLADSLPDVVKLFLIDTPEMAGDAIVWLTAEKRDWLAGRLMSAQWNMEEILGKKDKIIKEDHLKMRMSVGRD